MQKSKNTCILHLMPFLSLIEISDEPAKAWRWIAWVPCSQGYFQYMHWIVTQILSRSVPFSFLNGILCFLTESKWDWGNYILQCHHDHMMTWDTDHPFHFSTMLWSGFVLKNLKRGQTNSDGHVVGPFSDFVEEPD